jgi:hypothetical protein
MMRICYGHGPVPLRATRDAILFERTRQVSSEQAKWGHAREGVRAYGDNTGGAAGHMGSNLHHQPGYEMPPHTDAHEAGGPQLREALDRIEQIVLDGLRHGHFRCAISSGIGKNDRRELVIEAGKSHKFTIPKDELPR